MAEWRDYSGPTYGALRTWRRELPSGKTLEITAGMGEVCLSLLDFRPCLMRFPHWPAPSTHIPGHLITLVLKDVRVTEHPYV